MSICGRSSELKPSDYKKKCVYNMDQKSLLIPVEDILMKG